MAPRSTRIDRLTTRAGVYATLAVLTLVLFSGCAALPKAQEAIDPDATDEPQGTGRPRPTGVGGENAAPYDGPYPWIGAWLEDWPTDERPMITEWETRTGVNMDLIDIFADWYTPVRNLTHTLTHITAQGTMPVITWEPHGITTPEIADGSRQITLRNGRTMTVAKYIDEFSNGICKIANSTKMPIFIRPMHEMNGDWYSWGIGYQAPDGSYPNTDETFKAAWNRIFTSFDGRCGQYIRMVWAVNHFSVGIGTSILGTYPGDDQVDYVGIDGFNWGSRYSWQGFDMLFADVLCTLYDNNAKPILLSEVASSEQGGDKADWIDEFYTRLLETPRIKGFVWLDHPKFEVELNTAMDWQIESSPESRDAWIQGAQKITALRNGAANDVAPFPPC